jgi:hypothetical protein
VSTPVVGWTEIAVLAGDSAKEYGGVPPEMARVPIVVPLNEFSGTEKDWAEKDIGRLVTVTSTRKRVVPARLFATTLNE